MEHIARVYTDFTEKFGIPRQSRLVNTRGKIVFEEKYRNPDAVRGIDEFSHLWLIWEFSENIGKEWSPTVRPPRLGGNERRGVFATRAPFRPNPLGLSCVKLEQVKMTEKEGPVLYVSGVDMLNGTPLYDIKPYLPYTEAITYAKGGFADIVKDYELQVRIPEELLQKLSPEDGEILKNILSEDPRPSYQNDPERVYGMRYAGKNVKFRVNKNLLTVYEIEEEKNGGELL